MSRLPWRLGVVACVVVAFAVETVQAQPPIAIPSQQPGQQQPGQQGPITPMAPPQQVVPAPPMPAAPPWANLSPQELQQLELVLQAWEHKSGQVKTFSSEFDLWEYDMVWGKPNEPKKHSVGEVKYAQPDKGMYKINEEGGEYWMCDGNSVYQFNHTKRQLIEHRLPPQMRGKAISDGPLPFVFGVEAEKMKKRYWLRIVTPREVVGQRIHLEAMPKYREDAANFQLVEIMLSEPELTPFAVQIHEPNGKVRKVYRFEPSKTKINAAVAQLQGFLGIFVRPQTPFGWQYIVDEPPQQTVPAPGEMAPQQQGPMPATRPLLPRR